MLIHTGDATGLVVPQPHQKALLIDSPDVFFDEGLTAIIEDDEPGIFKELDWKVVSMLLQQI